MLLAMVPRANRRGPAGVTIHLCPGLYPACQAPTSWPHPNPAGRRGAALPFADEEPEVASPRLLSQGVVG